MPLQAVFCGSCGLRAQTSCQGCAPSRAAGQAYCLACGSKLPGAAGPEFPDSDRRVVTVLFADVEGFTALSSRLDPERVTEILNDFFEVLTEPVDRCGGVVDKYMGDAIMALFGAPVAHEDDPERAVLAALEMQEAAQRYAASLAARTGIELALRVGVNTGLVVAGAVGSGARRDYTVMGEAVNLAQRLETAAASGTVLVGEATCKVTRERVDYAPVGELTLKGVPGPVRAYRAIGVRPIPRGEFHERAPMIGRQSELSRLLTCLDNLRGGTPQVVGLVGEAGIGKSRLAREFVDRIRLRGTERLVRARCPSYGRDHALRLLAALVTAWLGIEAPGAPAALKEALVDKAMHSGYPDAEAVAELIVPLLAPAWDRPSQDGLTPRQRRDAAFAAVSELLVHEARRQPLVLEIDDLQWADAGSLDWLNSFIDRLGTEREALPVLVFYQSRPRDDESSAEWARKVDLTQIVLRPLPLEDQRALLALALGLPGSPGLWPPEIAQLADQVLARTEGNPLFLWELVKSLVDNRVLRRTSTHWEVTRQAGESDLPTSIKGVVAARLDALPHGLRSALQVASVIGRNFTSELLAEIYPGDTEAVCAELVGRDFFHRRDNGEIAFNQAFIQEVAYESLLLSTRRELHRKAGEAIEARLAERRYEAVEVLAYHFSRAGVLGKAAEYLYLAGRRALLAYASDDALRAFEQALGFLPGDDNPLRVEILAGLAEVEALLGDYSGAQKHAQEAIALQTEPRQLAELHCLMARNLDRQGAYPEALELLERAIAALRDLAPDVIPKLLLENSWIEMRIGNYDKALALSRQALERVLTSPGASASDLAQAHNNMGVCYYRMNEWEHALRHHDHALRLRTQAQDLMGIADALTNLGLVHYQRGDWASAQDHYHRGLALYERLGDVAKRITLQLNLGTLQLDMGQADEALANFERTRALAERTGNTFMLAVSQIVMGNALAASGQIDEALAQLEGGLGVLERIEALEVQPEAHQILGRILVSLGRVDEGRRHLERGLELASQLGDRLQKGILERQMAVLLVQEGRLEEAERTLERASAALSRLGCEIEVARALLVAADLYARTGRPERAEQAKVEAARVFERIGARPDLDRARNLLVSRRSGSS